MAAQTTTIETVTVVRPLKVIALLCMIVAFGLLIACLATGQWLNSGSLIIGLFQECSVDTQWARLHPVPNAPKPGECQGHSRDSFPLCCTLAQRRDNECSVTSFLVAPEWEIR
ncbi:hypothetical protein L596_002868 [Steinernema carpocapsae]|uniref:Uncharacterized protein n=1 Tax=Steinernema carpocapsae TaxID=34508 RepID=A0A4U8UQY1_STECR|nr:hypothetical protein L596_002868 [Steinernema carpocapsae]